MTFRWDSDTLTPLLAQLDERFNTRVAAVCQYQATRAEAYIRQQAPWNDQTGNARQGLFAVAERNGNIHRIILAHAVPYGIWLEVRFAGRYAVIVPSLRNQGDALMALLERAFREAVT
jgi:hypothetical protein